MFNMVCEQCDGEYDLHGSAKRKAGGKRSHCPDCAEESAVKYAGVQAADGKQSQATILKFGSTADREAYLKYWQNNSGLHKGKSCQLGSHLSTTPAISFTTVQRFTPTNHKGKASA